MQGELRFACAETDDWAPPEMIAELDRHLGEAGVRHTIEWYPGTHHGFAFPGRGEIYDKACGETLVAPICVICAEFVSTKQIARGSARGG